MNPTHALYVIDNWDGEGDRYWVLAYRENDCFYSADTGKQIFEYVGNEIIKEIELVI